LRRLLARELIETTPARDIGRLENVDPRIGMAFRLGRRKTPSEFGELIGAVFKPADHRAWSVGQISSCGLKFGAEFGHVTGKRVWLNVAR
jgi:hypothetical protein